MRKFLIFALCIIFCLFIASWFAGGSSSDEGASKDSSETSQSENESASDDGSSSEAENDSSTDSSAIGQGSNCAQLEAEIMQGKASQDELENSKNIEAYLSSEYYPYYESLDSSSKAMYREVLAGLEKGDKEIKIKKGVNKEKSKKVLTYVFLDHPQLFWCTGDCSYQSKGDKVVSVKPEYNSFVNDLESSKSQIEGSALAVVNETDGMDELEAERYFHDYLCQAITYQSGENDQNIYSAFVDGKTVCAGYARAMQYLMQLRGIPCYYCSGTSESPISDKWEGHAWNIVKLGSSFYNVDVTWDDSLNEPDRDISLILYTYFNRTDEDFSADHERDDDGKVLPACEGTEYSYESYYGHPWGEDLSDQLDLSQAAPVTSLDEYDSLWENEFASQGAGTHELVYVIHGADALNDVEAQIDANSTDGYIGNIASALGLNGYSYSTQYTSYDLGDDYYLVSQSMTIE